MQLVSIEASIERKNLVFEDCVAETKNSVLSVLSNNDKQEFLEPMAECITKLLFQ